MIENGSDITESHFKEIFGQIDNDEFNDEVLVVFTFVIAEFGLDATVLEQALREAVTDEDRELLVNELFRRHAEM